MSAAVAATAPAAGGGFSTFYLFATALAAGVAACLPLVPIRQIGRRFFILMTLIAAVSYALATASRGIWMDPFHALCAGLLVLYNVSVSERGGPISYAVLSLAAVAGAVGLVRDAASFPVELPVAGPQALWLALASTSSALVLGGALVAMLLGHWYLVAHGLSFGVLGRLVALLIAALVLRAAVMAAAGVAQGEAWTRLWEEAGGFYGFATSQGLFPGIRVLFGIVLPVVLGVMAAQCVRIRSNQSATGILYVVVVFAIIGEAVAKHLLAAKGLVL
jgi:hypothetical protein